MAQAQSPHERDGTPLAQTMSTEEKRGAGREGRFRRALSRMVKTQEPPSPEIDQGHPVHHPVHPHSHNPGHTPQESGSEPVAGPFPDPVETGYRRAVPAKIPNPYTVRNQEVDDVDTGATPVGTWRGVGMNEPATPDPTPPATTDTMTNSPHTAEHAERPETSPAPTTETASPTPGPRPSDGETPPQAQDPRPQNDPEPTMPPQAAQQWQGQPPPAPPHGPRWDGPPPTYGHQASHPGGYQQTGPHGPPQTGPHSQQPYPQQPPHPGYQQHPPHPPAPQGHGGYPHPGEYAAPAGPPPYPMPYPQASPYAYPNPCPHAYQPSGYVLPGQPVVHPSHFGQPVQHIVVFTPGQQPQIVTADAVASTLLPERTDPSAEQETSGDKELTRGEAVDPTESGTPSEQDRVTGETPEQPAAPEATQETTSDKDDVTQTGTKGPDEGLLNEALAGLAMRDLSLVDALLEMVETLETDTQDPDLLDKLFQIDNFATRMRRNGENFLVLTGHDGGESDAHDEIVPLLDVARAATSEIKDYPRVSLGKLPQASLTGMAADDISHLLAELLDNATANSPEHAQVVISAQRLDDGKLMIVVEDEGVGIPEPQLVELNERLRGAPVLDDEIRRHMGLYVAGRIAHKHGLEIRLEARSFRGISAYTIIPEELLRVATPPSPRRAGAPSTSTSTPPAPSGPSLSVVPPRSSGPSGPSGNGPGKPRMGGDSTTTSAGLPRRSASRHASPLRDTSRTGRTPNDPPKARADTPPKLTGDARAEQIRDELGDFFDGEREAREEGNKPEDGKK